MASALSRSVRRFGSAASFVGTSYVPKRSLSASVRRFDEEKPPHSSPSAHPSTSDTSNDRSQEASSSGTSDGAVSSSGYQPPSKVSGAWPFDSTSSTSSTDSAPAPSEASSSSSTNNPYAGLFEGNDPFPKVTVPKLGASTSSSESPSTSSSSSGANWLSDQLDSLSTAPRNPNNTNNNASFDGRKKHAIPRSVLFADSESARQSEDFKPRKPYSASSNTRKRFDRTPLTQQEANAFMSLLNQALAGTSSAPTPSPLSSSSSSPYGTQESSGAAHTPFGSYTSLISNPKTQSGSKALLQAFAKRNRLKRFEEAQAQRARKFAREGLAAEIDPLELEAGIDEAREGIAMCENLSELIDWAKREVWGIGGSSQASPSDLAGMLSGTTSNSASESLEGKDGQELVEQKKGPKYGKDTPYYPSVLHILFLALRDRYRAPHIALSIPRITRGLGIESYVLGVTGSLYNEVLKTQWDWLGDLQGVVTTLRQARETGILSAPLKTSPVAPPPQETGAIGGRGGYATTEDEAIRETVDRIANEVRKYVVDQQMSTDPWFKRNYLYGAEDVLSSGRGGTKDKLTLQLGSNWSLKWLLKNAELATTFAGQPFRLIQRQLRSDGERSGASRFSKAGGDGERRGGGGFKASGSDRYSPRSFKDKRDGGYKGKDDRSASRYPTSSYSSRLPKRYSSSSL